MCVELPSKIIQIKGKKAKIKQGDKSCWIDISVIDQELKKGDYLISYQKVAINKIPEKEINKILEVIGDLIEPHSH